MMWEIDPSDVAKWREEAGISRDFSMTEFLKKRMQTETTKRDERPERTAEENEAGYAEILRIKEELGYGRPKVLKVTNGVKVIETTQDSDTLLIRNLEARADIKQPSHKVIKTIPYESPEIIPEGNLEAHPKIEQPPHKKYTLQATIKRHEREAALRKKRLKRVLPFVVIGGISIIGTIINGISIANIIYNNEPITISNSNYLNRTSLTNSISQYSAPKDTIPPSPVPEGAWIYYAKAGEKLDSIAIHNNMSLIDVAILNPTARNSPLPDSFIVYIPLKEHPIHSGKYTKADSVIANTPIYSGQRQQLADAKSLIPKNNNHSRLYQKRKNLRK